MSESAPGPQLSPAAPVALAVVGCIPYALLLAALYFGPPGGDPRVYGGEGRIAEAYAELYTLVFGVLTWVVLGVLTVIGIRSGLPEWARTAAGLLYPASAIAAFFASQADYDFPGGWSILVPAVLPPLIACGVIWLRSQRLRAVAPVERACAAGLCTIAIVCAATIPLNLLDRLQLPAHIAVYERRQDELAARQRADLESLKAEIEASRRALNPDSPLRDHLEYVNSTNLGTPEHEQALAGARGAKSRQGDAIALLNGDRIVWLEELPALDIEATAVLCAAYDAALTRQANEATPFDNSVGQNVERQIPNIRFLVARHCSLDTGIAAAVARVQKILDKLGPQDGARPGWTEVRDTLVALRPAK